MRKFVIALASIGLLTFYGCAMNQMMKMAKEQKLTVDPDPLELHAGQVKFNISAVLPVKMLKPNLTYSIEVRYDYADKHLESGYGFDQITFKPDAYPNSDTQNPKASVSMIMPWKGDEMTPGKLVARGWGTNNKNGKKAGPTDWLEIATGVITTSTLVKPVFYAAVVSYDYKDATVQGWTPDEELEPTYVNFYFLQGSSVLRWSEKKSDRGKFLQAFIAEKNVTRSVSITGTHSPEGPERINSKLSENRAKVIEDYYKQMMDKYDYKGAAESIKFILKPVVDDWTEFKKLLEQYDGIDESAKSEILSIVNGSGTFEEKEKQLEKLPVYKKIFKDIYPELRRARTEILTVIEKRSDAEISVLAKQIVEGKLPADTLSYGELAYAAHLTPSVDEKIAIYEAAVKTYDQWACHNNLGAAYMMKAIETKDTGLVEKAITQFEVSLRQKHNCYATGNMGVAEALQGNYGKAYELVSSALEMPLSAKAAAGLSGTKGALEIMQAKYTDAVKTLSNAKECPNNLYNKALAQIMVKDYQNAVITSEEVTDKASDYAMAYYLKAVAESRLGKTSDAIAALKQAIAADPTLKTKAAGDLEFSKMFSDSNFISVVK